MRCRTFVVCIILCLGSCLTGCGTLVTGLASQSGTAAGAAAGKTAPPAALDKLISIARSDKDLGSRKKALFWVGQSHDPRALKAITEVIEK